MPLASANLTQMRLILESVYGTTPVTGAANNLRMTGESLAFAIQTATSKEIRSDRQISDLVQTGASASGGVNFELSYNEYDKLTEAALMGTWVGANDVSMTATITLSNTLTASTGTPFAGLVIGQTVQFSGWATAANNQPFTILTVSPTVITVTGTPWTNEAAVTVALNSYGVTTLSVTTSLFATTPTVTAASGAPFANVVAGQYIRIAGMTTAGNNGLKKVASKTSSTVVVLVAGSLTANETTALTTLSSSRLSNGTVQRSFTLEKQFSDITQFFAYRGMNVNKLSLTFASGSIVTGSFDFLGKDSLRGAVTAMPGTAIASQTNDVMNAVAGVASITEGGSLLTGTFVKTLSLNVGNNLRGMDGIGVLGNAAIAPGSADITGTMEVYLKDGALYDKFIANTATSMFWTVADSSGKGYGFTLPKIKFSDAKVVAGSLNSDVMLSIPFTAIMDPTTTKTLIIDRL